MHQTTTYAIYWNPTGTTISNSVKSLTERFLTDLGGNYYGAMNQYYDSVGSAGTQYITADTRFGGTWVDDTNAYDNAGSTTDPLSDASTQQEITRAINANPDWEAPGLSTLYELFIGENIEFCEGNGDCTYPKAGHETICAYHGSYTQDGATVVYAQNGNDAGRGCGPDGAAQAPTEAAADAEVSTASHETFEAITDPLGAAWRAGGSNYVGEEIGDLCAYNYGTTDSDGSNLTMNGHRYQVQREWSNATADADPGHASGCDISSGAVETSTGSGSTSPGTAAFPACTDNAVPANDDGSGPQVTLPFTANFYSKPFTSLWVNNNGNVTFDGPLRTYTPFGLLSTSAEIIAPFFADVDTRSAGSELVTYGGQPARGPGQPAYFCVNWSNVGYYAQRADKLNSFQLILIDRSAQTGVAGDFDIEFNYDKVQWETGEASGGVDGLGGFAAVVGYSNGSTKALELPGSALPGALIDGGYSSLIQGSTGSATPGRYIFQVRNGGAPDGGTVRGTVTDGGGALVVGAAVQICDSSNACSFTQTNAHGVYAVTGLAPGSYGVQVNPPSGSSLLTGYGATVLSASDQATADITLGNAFELPDSVIMTYHRVTADGVPVLEWGGHDTLSFSGCVGGTARATIETTDAAARSAGASLSESFAVPEIVPLGVHTGEYLGNVPDPNPGVGPATITLAVTCPDASLNQTLQFTVYIDPSGSVLDQNGHPVSGATVTLLRSDNPDGPFLAVPNGSALMSVGNRANPDTTTADGTFGWDVLTGYYQVQASKTGCTNPSDSSSDTVTSPTFPVPPPVTQLRLVLHCPSATDTTSVTYTGPTTGSTHDPLTVSGELSDTSTGEPVPSATLTLTFADQSCTASTDSNGIATCTVTPTAASGPTTAHADFAGTASLAPASSATTPVILDADETSLSLVPLTAFATGRPVTLSAILEEDATTPLPTRSVTFTIGAGTTAQTCTGVTGRTGQASCTVTVNQAGGPTAVSASFAGDSYDQTASATSGATVFAYLDPGAFVVADGNQVIGSTVTFWGAQWCSKNGVSGSCPSGFKGYADGTPAAPYAVGGTWTADPGVSGRPPAVLPSYMAVLATAAATQSGSTVSGTITHVIIVKIAPGYTADPGGLGAGQIVAVLP